MITRVWHGWTKPEEADNYEDLLNEVIFPGIAARSIRGYKKIQLLRRLIVTEVEFTVIMWFENLEAVKTFAGEEYNRAYVPESAQKLLSRFDKESQHYECKTEIDYSNN
jgi:hypothetical protein